MAAYRLVGIATGRLYGNCRIYKQLPHSTASAAIYGDSGKSIIVVRSYLGTPQIFCFSADHLNPRMAGGTDPADFLHSAFPISNSTLLPNQAMKANASALAILIAFCAFTALPARLYAAELEASDGDNSAYFGSSVNVSGNIGLVGAFYANSNNGSAYVFRSLDSATGTVTENVKLTASDAAYDDLFGMCVSQSGTIGLVGAYGKNSAQGAAYVFRSLDAAGGTVTQNVKLTASDAAAYDQFGRAVSQSGTIGLVGALGTNLQAGAAYVFRGLDAATGTVTQNVKLTASDAAAYDNFGISVSLSDTIGLVGAYGKNSAQGAAYIFRGLNTVTGTVTESVKLTASDAANYEENYFGVSVSQSGTIGLVGAYGQNSNQGAAYLFRGLDTATATVTENVKLTASDAAIEDFFGYSVSLSGTTGLVGASGKNSAQGAAYLFRGLDTASATVTENVKLTASNAANNDFFGYSVSLSGDQFIIGAQGKNSATGEAYTGTISSVTTLDTGNASRTIDGISFVSQDDWIIGETTDNNQVTLTAGDSANVTASGKGVFIGKNAGSDNNKLIIAGDLIANQITIGASGNAGNTLQVGAGGTTGSLSTESVITNNEMLIFNRSDTITQGTDFGSAAILGAGTLVKQGAGTLTMSGSYGGGQTPAPSGFGTLVNSGTLVLASGGFANHRNGMTAVGYDSGDNAALVLSGGHIIDTTAVLGWNAGSQGSATVTSGTWETQTLVVGNSGTGSLAIIGGLVSANQGYIGSGSNGTATVSGGVWNMVSDLLVGQFGAGTLAISGGAVSNQSGLIASSAGSSGTATVTGGTWSNSNSLTVGVSGTGTLNLANTGAVTVNAGSGTLTLAQFAGSSGTLNLGTGGTSIGTLDAAQISGGAGSASVNFNLSGTTTFAPQLAGSLAVTKSGAGTLTFSGSNSYSGGTVLNAGTLIADHNHAFGTGSITINAGTLLVQAGVTTSNSVVLNGGALAKILAGGTDLANTIDTTSTLGGSTTGALLLGGTASAFTTLQSSFAATSGAANDDIRLSSVFSLHGVPVIEFESGKTDTFVLQLQLANVQSDSFLGWLDPGSNQWINAVFGNIGGTAAFQGDGAYNPSTDFVLGYYGVDTSAHTVWAVINHNSDFGVIPEPSTWALLAVGAVALFVFRRRTKMPSAPFRSHE